MCFFRQTPRQGEILDLLRDTVNLFSILHYSRSSRVSRTGIVGHAQVVKEQASVSVELADFLSDVFDTLGFDQADGKAA